MNLKDGQKRLAMKGSLKEEGLERWMEPGQGGLHRPLSQLAQLLGLPIGGLRSSY